MMIRKVVIPAAGWGTRLLPLTKALPKVMLPVAGKPVLQYVVEEAAEAGLRQVIFVTGKGGELIWNHFSPDPSLREFLMEKGQGELLGNLGFENLDVEFFYTPQDIPKGLGNAILQAGKLVAGEDFVVALGDAILESPPGDSAIRKLIQVRLERNASAVLAVEALPEADLSKYGVVNPLPGQEGFVLDLEGVVEKPAPGNAPSPFAIAARYVFTPEIFDALLKKSSSPEKEWELTDAINRLIEDGKRVCAVVLGENQKRHDVGHFAGYYKVFHHFADKGDRK